MVVPQLPLPQSAEAKAVAGRAGQPTSARQPTSATRSLRPPPSSVFTDDVVLPPTLHVPVHRVAPQPQALRTMGALGVAPVPRGEGRAASEGGIPRGRRRHRGSAEGSGQTTTANQVTRVHQRLSAPPALLPVRPSPMAFRCRSLNMDIHSSAGSSLLGLCHHTSSQSRLWATTWCMRDVKEISTTLARPSCVEKRGSGDLVV